MNERERDLRRRLGVLDDASQVLVFEQAAHCDWDWNKTNPHYFSSEVDADILPKAMANIAAYPNHAYTYVFCEVGYLQKFWDSLSASQQAAWVAAVGAGTFQFSSGGITSAENLILHTEAFVRNYLLGRQWVAATFNGAQPSLQMWIPDDFGHDAQLPALLQAMGYTGAGFWRIPGQWGSPKAPGATVTIGSTAYKTAAADGAPSAFLVTDTQSVDFTWRAQDSSSVQAHWLMGSYLQGNNGYNNVGGFGQPPTIAKSSVEADISEFITFFKGLAPFGYMFVPIDADFCEPYSNLPRMVHDWNQAYAAKYGVTVTMSTFDYFMQLVSLRGGLPIVETNPVSGKAYLPHPYWSGCYGTHPGLKLAHYQTVRTLLLAETMELILEYLSTVDSSWTADASAARAALAAAWTSLVPSTHHDYITGTSPNAPGGNNDDVYDDEQVPLLATALTQASAAQASILSVVAAAIDPGSGIQGTAMALFNPIAIVRSAAFVELSVDDPSQYASSTTDGSTCYPVQVAASGTLLTLSTVPALGYATAWLTATAATESPTLTISGSGGEFTLANDYVKATITTAGITGLYDLSGDPGTNLFGSEIGNALVYYADTGGLYRFGSEVVLDEMQFQAVAATCSASIAQSEGGPVRVSVIVTGTASVGTAAPVPFSIIYSLVALEKILRITTESAAPASADGVTGYSVMVSFPLGSASAIAELGYGTTAHWDRRAPRGNFIAWSVDSQPSSPPPELDEITFEPTHEYVAPYDAGSTMLGAIYHYSVPGWAISSDGTSVYGCILRNTPNNVNGAYGTDTASHTQAYAVRVPGGLSDPATGCGGGTPLGEALLFNNPIAGVPIPSTSSQTLRSSMIVAATADTTALVTVAKAGTVDATQMIVRVYQPTNGTLSGISVAIDPKIATLFQSGGVLNVSGVTALETASGSVRPSGDAGSFSLDMSCAWASVALSRPTQGPDKHG